MAGEAPFTQADQEGLSGLAQRPQRMYIHDLSAKRDDSQETTLTAQFNPTEFEEELKVEWARLMSVGLSYKWLQYVATDNTSLSFELLFDAGQPGSSLDTVAKARRFLRSMCFPRRGASSIREGQIPRLLFVWPNFITLSAVMCDLKFKFDQFALSGQVTRFTARVKIEEISDVRTYLEDERGPR